MTNTGNKDIKAIKSYLGADLFWYDEDGKLSGLHSGDNNSNSIKREWTIKVQVNWPMNGNLKAGQTQTYSLPFHSVKYDFVGIIYDIHSLVYSDVIPYWIDYGVFSGSWGKKNLPLYTPHFNYNNLIFYNAVRIPDFNPIENS